jgi:hypothetical protein
MRGQKGYEREDLREESLTSHTSNEVDPYYAVIGISVGRKRERNKSGEAGFEEMCAWSGSLPNHTLSLR